MVNLGRAASVIAIGLALLVPDISRAASSPGLALDPSFGDHGIRRLPAEATYTAYGVPAQGGNLLVSGGSRVRVLNDVGGAGRAFGASGSLALPPARGTRFQLSDFTIDRRGRLVVVGTTLFPESENPSPYIENGSRAFRPEVLRVFRFLPGGRLDPSFGHGGVVETGLGLPPPVGVDGKALGSRPSVAPSGVAVDPQGRIVISGSAVVRLGEACKHDSFAAVGVGAGFVARFTSTGSPDLGFGDDGLVGGRSMSENALRAETIGEPVVGPRGGITYLSTRDYPCERGRSHLGVGQLTPSGRTRKTFGRDGAIVGRFHALAAGPQGAVFALAEEARSGNDPVRAQVLRIAPDGKLDRSFGKDGQARLRLGPGFGTRLDSLAVDSRGRVLVGGTIEARKGNSIVLLRVSARGHWETNFGPYGRVATPVPGLAERESSGLFFDRRGRLVTLHLYANKGRSGLVVARYLLRN